MKQGFICPQCQQPVTLNQGYCMNCRASFAQPSPSNGAATVYSPPSGHMQTVSENDLSRTMVASGVLEHSGIHNSHNDLLSSYRRACEEDPFLALHAATKFQTESVLGRGGMGVVHQIVDQRLNRRAALKTLQADSVELQRRFLREARLTASLDHPGIPPIYELGREPGGQLYLLMQVIQGTTFKDIINNYHKNPGDEKELRQLLEILVKACDAVAYAHDKGIIHRDLKPDNIMVGAFGEVLVMDWGLAKDLKSDERDISLDKSKSLEEELDLTQVGAVLGTLGYMPPEQAEGAVVDTRADVFALGAILTTVLTGSPPINGPSNINRLNSTLKGNIDLPGDRVAIPADLNFIAEQALEFESDDRSEDVATFARQLRQFLNHEPVEGYDYSVLGRFKKSLRRKPERAVFSLATAVFTLLALFGVYIFQNEQAKNRELKVDKAKVETEKNQIEEELAYKNKLKELIAHAKLKSLQGASGKEIQTAIDAVLKLGKNDKSLVVAMAQLLKRGDLGKEYKKFLDDAERQFSPCYEVYYERHVRKLESQGKFSQSTEWSDKILAIAGKRGDENEYTLFCKALKLDEAGQNEEALKLYNEIDKKYDHRLYSLYHNRGWIHQRTQKPYSIRDKVLKDYGKALSISPRYSMCLMHRGALYRGVHKDFNCRRDLSQALSIREEFSGGDPQINYELGLMYNNERRPEAAVFNFNMALRSNYEPPGIYYWKAANNLRLGKLHLYLNDMALHHLTLGKLKKASELIHSAFQQTGIGEDGYELTYSKARILIAAGNVVKGKALLQSIVDSFKQRKLPKQVDRVKFVKKATAKLRELEEE